MRIHGYIIFIILTLLFIGCDSKDVVKNLAQVELEKKIEVLTQQNKDLEKFKNDSSLRINELTKENEVLKQNLEKLENRFKETANKLFK